MRAQRGGWGLVGRGAATAFLAFVLFLQATLSGRDALRAAAPAFDPAGVICAAHPDPDGGDRAPAGPHDPCCTLLCGAGGVPPPVALPVAGPALLPPARLGSTLGRPADECLDPWRRYVRHGARAPPISA